MIAWLLIPAGIIIILKADKIGDTIGVISFAETIFGTGGTYNFIKVSGLLITILSFMWITGGLQSILKTVFQ